MAITSNKALPVVYKDLDLNFTAHPSTGDVSILKDSRSITQSLTTLCMAATGEFLGDLDMGGGVGRILFEQEDKLLEHKLTQQITQTIEAHEPRIELVAVLLDVTQGGKAVVVRVQYYMLNQPNVTTSTISLTALS